MSENTSKKKVQCAHCNEIFEIDLPDAQLTRAELEEALKTFQLPGELDHRHKTANEFLDCPECRLWVDNTAGRYKVVEIEQPLEEKPGDLPGDKEPVKTAIGSIFKRGGGHDD